MNKLIKTHIPEDANKKHEKEYLIDLICSMIKTDGNILSKILENGLLEEKSNVALLQNNSAIQMGFEQCWGFLRMK